MSDEAGKQEESAPTLAAVPQAVEVVQEFVFSDHELAHLTIHFLARVNPQNMLQQQDFNRVFTVLALDRFEQPRLNPDAVTPVQRKYAVPLTLVAFILESLGAPMIGKSTRVIGAGTRFFLRLIQPVQAQATPPPNGKPAANPEPGPTVEPAGEPPTPIESAS